MRYWKSRQRLVGVALVLAFLAMLTLGSASGLATVEQDVLVNGSFEGGFASQPGCGMVGKGWGCFTNGGTVAYGFYDDQWAKVVADGAHSQLIELNTMQYAASEPDRYAGIYQTVSLVPGATYTLKLQGLMRERDPNASDDKYRYRVQWGFTADGSTDWKAVSNWQELPWDKIDNRTSPTGLQSFKGTLVAPTGKITLFIRVWKKWGTAYKELDVNLDAISLVGPATKNIVIVKPGEKHPPVVIVKPGGPTTLPVQLPAALTCGGNNLIANGNFEGGFVNGVGTGWTRFTNGGAAVYGFYDEMWPPVVKSPAHGQLIEINTWGMAAADPNRTAGIYQVVRGLKPGATYEISLWGMLREDAVHSGDDPFRYRVLWGYAPADADPTNADITHWAELPWDTIYTRTAPGAMSSFSGRFQAPSESIVIAFSALKKWGTVQRELDVNLDSISLTPCGGAAGECIYVVARGDTLNIIARKNHTTAAVLIQMNGLKNPNVLLVGQKLKVPCDGQPPVIVIDGGHKPPPDGGHKPPDGGAKPPDGGQCLAYVVQKGDTVTKIAAHYGSSVAAISAANHLKNANLIYVGQKLCIPAP
jgi:LysM repeat protein